MKIIIVGGGPGTMDFLSSGGAATIKSADVVLTSTRLSDEIASLNDNIKVMGIGDTIEFLKRHSSERDMNIAVLASGDVGFYSIATTIRKRLLNDLQGGMHSNDDVLQGSAKNPNAGFDNAIPDIELIPGLSSFQIFAARLSQGYEDWKLISLHGLDRSILPYASYYRKTFALTGGRWDVASMIDELVNAGLGHVKVYVGERLSMEGEKITVGRADRLSGKEFDKLAVVLIENKNFVKPYQTLKDDDYYRGKAPMTKEAVRNLSIDALEIAPSDVVWDVGAGSGGVTCAMALKAYESMVYAVEMKKDAIKILRENRSRFGAYNVKIIEGRAPDALIDLPVPDKVFIGGSTGSLREILDMILFKNPKVKIVVNAITLETIGKILDSFKRLNLKTEIISATIAKSKKLGNYNMMIGENPIYIVKGERDEEN